MKIAIPAEGKSITDPVDVRFGRCRGFIIFDTGSDSASYIENIQNTQAVQGAGIQAAKTIIDSGAEILISGNVGPKAFTALKSADIKIYLCGKCSVREALNDLKKGQLESASGASVESHW